MSTVDNGGQLCRIVLSGYFCTGKTSIMQMLYKEMNLKKPKDFTTRAMRVNEKEGDPYFFITKEQFALLERRGKLFDPIEHDGHRYGVDYDDIFGSRRWVMDILPTSWDKFNKITGVIGIYLIPPSIDVLKKRAILRGDSLKSIEKRLLLLRPQDLSSYHYVIEPQPSLEELFLKTKVICQKLWL
jgi:guanylate kinase